MCAAMHHLMKMAANASDTDFDGILAFSSSHRGGEGREDTEVCLYTRFYKRVIFITLQPVQ